MIRRTMRWLAALAALGCGTPAVAAETPRNWVLELQFGGYSPDVDDNVAGTPFADVFGNKNRLLSLLSLERLIFKEFGTLGLGLQSGYAGFHGKSFVEGTEERSGDATSLHVIPLTLFAAYRFDYAAQHWNFPFAIYGKAGAGYWFWWVNDEDGNTAGNGEASGAKLGYTLSAGVSLLLDWFDPKLANEFDRDFGVNNTYLYVDYTRWTAKARGNFFEHGFGAFGLDLSDEIWSGGIAFEF